MVKNVHKELRTLISTLVEDNYDKHLVKEELLINRLLENDELRKLVNHINGFFFIFNYTTSHYEYFSDNIRSELGIDPQQMLGEEGALMVYNMIYEPHRQVFMQVMQNVLGYLAVNSTKESGTDFRFTSCLKLRNVYGNYQWFLFDTHIIESDEKGFPIRSFITVTNIDVAKKDDLLYYNILKKDNNGVYTNVYQGLANTLDEDAQLTNRELEIINLIVEGYTSTEIAEKLFISLHTVNTHRKNLLKKTNCKGTAELTKYAFARGLI